MARKKYAIAMVLEKYAVSPASSISQEVLERKRGYTSKYRGVCWNKKNRRWQASINNSGKYEYLGSYKSEREAAIEFDKAALRYRGAAAKLNFNGEFYESKKCMTDDSDMTIHLIKEPMENNEKCKRLLSPSLSSNQLNIFNKPVKRGRYECQRIPANKLSPTASTTTRLNISDYQCVSLNSLPPPTSALPLLALHPHECIKNDNIKNIPRYKLLINNTTIPDQQQVFETSYHLPGTVENTQDMCLIFNNVPGVVDTRIREQDSANIKCMTFDDNMKSPHGFSPCCEGYFCDQQYNQLHLEMLNCANKEKMFSVTDNAVATHINSHGNNAPINRVDNYNMTADHFLCLENSNSKRDKQYCAAHDMTMEEVVNSSAIYADEAMLIKGKGDSFGMVHNVYSNHSSWRALLWDRTILHVLGLFTTKDDAMKAIATSIEVLKTLDEFIIEKSSSLCYQKYCTKV